MTSDRTHDQRLVLRLPTELRERLDAIAKRERRTLSDWARLALEAAADASEAETPRRARR